MDFISHDIEDLSPDTLSHVKTPYNYRCYVVGNPDRKRWYLLGCGVRAQSGSEFRPIRWILLLKHFMTIGIIVNFSDHMFLNGMVIPIHDGKR